jgi:NTE family protein
MASALSFLAGGAGGDPANDKWGWKMTKALVLGGGGPVGIAWETGLLAGLADGGADVSRADWILGTSAGSFVGAHLAMGRNPAAMLKAEFAAADIVREASGDPRPAPDLTPLMSVMMSKPPGEVMPLDGRMKLAAMALDAKTVSEETFIAGFGPLAEGEHPWPTGYACTAVDTADGELVIWDEDKAAPLIRAIASSCSVPTIFPPITIDGRRYIDGGMRSGTNADLAKSHGKVLLIAVAPPAFAPFMMPGINAELAAVQAAGGETCLILPDAGSGEAFGPNLMDGSRRADIARAGHAQGLAEAERIRAFWG